MIPDISSPVIVTVLKPKTEENIKNINTKTKKSKLKVFEIHDPKDKYKDKDRITI